MVSVVCNFRPGHFRLENEIAIGRLPRPGGQLVICIVAITNAIIHFREPSVDATPVKYLDYLSGVLRGPELVALVAFSVDPNNFYHYNLQRLFTTHFLEGPYPTYE